jgi:hypothetical protein
MFDPTSLNLLNKLHNMGIFSDIPFTKWVDYTPAKYLLTKLSPSVARHTFETFVHKAYITTVVMD